MTEWIEQFGYLAIYFGALLEGEIVLISGVIAAKNDLLMLWPVPLLVFLSAQSVDWFWFLLGRYKGGPWIKGKKGLESKVQFIRGGFQKYPDRILLFYRFLIGFRTVVPLFAGISHVHPRSWAAYSLLSTLLWTILYTTIGYLCDVVLLQNLKSVQGQISNVFIVLILAAMGIGAFRFFRQKLFSK